MNYRDTIAHALAPIAMPAKTRTAVVDRVEPLLIDAVARGRRLARLTMRSRRLTSLNAKKSPRAGAVRTSALIGGGCVRKPV
jgi:hypothetical protein